MVKAKVQVSFVFRKYCGHRLVKRAASSHIIHNIKTTTVNNCHHQRIKSNQQKLFSSGSQKITKDFSWGKKYVLDGICLFCIYCLTCACLFSFLITNVTLSPSCNLKMTAEVNIWAACGVVLFATEVDYSVCSFFVVRF